MLNRQRVVVLGLISLAIGIGYFMYIKAQDADKVVDYSGRYEPERSHSSNEFIVLNKSGSVTLYEKFPGFTWKRAGHKIIISHPDLEDALLQIKGKRLYNPEDGTYFRKQK